MNPFQKSVLLFAQAETWKESEGKRKIRKISTNKHEKNNSIKTTSREEERITTFQTFFRSTPFLRIILLVSQPIKRNPVNLHNPRNNQKKLQKLMKFF